MGSISDIVNEWAREEKAQMFVDDVPEVSRNRLIERLEASFEPRRFRTDIHDQAQIERRSIDTKVNKEMARYERHSAINAATVLNKDGSPRRKPGRKAAS